MRVNWVCFVSSIFLVVFQVACVNHQNAKGKYFEKIFPLHWGILLVIILFPSQTLQLVDLGVLLKIILCTRTYTVLVFTDTMPFLKGEIIGEDSQFAYHFLNYWIIDLQSAISSLDDLVSPSQCDLYWWLILRPGISRELWFVTNKTVCFLHMVLVSA